MLKESERRIAELLEENKTLKINNIMLTDDLEICQAKLEDTDLGMRMLLDVSGVIVGCFEILRFESQQLSNQQNKKDASIPQDIFESQSEASVPELELAPTPTMQNTDHGAATLTSRAVSNISVPVDRLYSNLADMESEWTSEMVNWTDSRALDHFETTLSMF